MERNLEHELDELKQEMSAIRASLSRLLAVGESRDASTEARNSMDQGEDAPEQQPIHVGHVQKMPGMHGDPHIMAILDRLEDACGSSGSSGRLAYLGVYSSGGRQSTWIMPDVNADGLLTLIEEGTAEKVLACIGSSDRLNLLLAILRKPRTVAQLVGECGFTSTGQVYHHLKPLIAADLVTEDASNRGLYVIAPHRVQGILMLLAGISDMIDPQYSQGNL